MQFFYDPGHAITELRVEQIMKFRHQLPFPMEDRVEAIGEAPGSLLH